MTIGEKVKLYRDSHGESQRQFALRAGVSNTTIGSLEKGINPNTGKSYAPDISYKRRPLHFMFLDYFTLHFCKNKRPPISGRSRCETRVASSRKRSLTYFTF